MRMLLWAVGIAVFGWPIYHTDWTDRHRGDELPPGLQKMLEDTSKEVDADWNGPKGEEVRTICRRIAGVNVAAKTTVDVIGAGYSAATAEKYGECLSNYMYPIDAKTDEEYRRKAGVR